MKISERFIFKRTKCEICDHKLKSKNTYSFSAHEYYEAIHHGFQPKGFYDKFDHNDYTLSVAMHDLKEYDLFLGRVRKKDSDWKLCEGCFSDVSNFINKKM